MRKLIVVPALMLLILTAAAFADTEFKFTYNDPSYSLQGILTASADGGGVYTATGVSGTLTYASNTYSLILVPVGTTGRDASGDDLFGQDNQLFPSAPEQFLTVNPGFSGSGGILFMVPTPTAVSNYSGGSVLALWANGGGDYGSLSVRGLGGYGAGHNTGGTFTLSVVPEPSSVLLLIAMLLGVGVSLRAFNRKVV